MANPKEAPRALPPYVPYRTFLTFMESLRQAMPGRIDRTVMGTFSGAMQNQLFGALRYLGLINEQDIPHARLKQLVAADGAERTQILRSILEDGYPFLFKEEGFDLTNATLGQFEEQFRKIGASGDTVRKCATFFLTAAKEAEIRISPRITGTSRKRAPSNKTSRPRAEQASSKKPNTEENGRATNAPPSVPVDSAMKAEPTIRTVTLQSGGTLTLAITTNILKLSRQDRNFVFGLIDQIDEYEGDNSRDSGDLGAEDAPL